MPPVEETPRRVRVSSDHPCLPGHFPGRPIVPAVVVLDEVRAVIADAYPEQSINAIDYCKFQDFVLPDRSLEIVLEEADVGSIDFFCRSADDGRMLANGRVQLAPKDGMI